MIPMGVTGDGNKLQGGAGGASGAVTSNNTVSSGANFNSNGWTVATSGSKASSATSQGSGIPWYAYVAGGLLLVVGVVAWKKYS